VGPSGGPAQGLEGWRANATCATPQMPLTAAQVEEKFFECAADTVERPAATQIFAFMNRFEQEPSFAPLWPLTKRA
jgi:hypothetical protein